MNAPYLMHGSRDRYFRANLPDGGTVFVRAAYRTLDAEIGPFEVLRDRASDAVDGFFCRLRDRKWRLPRLRKIGLRVQNTLFSVVDRALFADEISPVIGWIMRGIIACTAIYLVAQIIRSW